MWQQYILGVGALLVVLAAWIGVQRAWRRAFSHVSDDPDALAGRTGCRGACDRIAGCQRACDGGSSKIEEDRR